VIWNPWRYIRTADATIAALEQAAVDRDRHIAEQARSLEIAADRYDLVREMNAQLRQTLELYRHNVEPAPVMLEYIDQPLPPMFPGLADG
jgi:hypothetical protein